MSLRKFLPLAEAVEAVADETPDRSSSWRNDPEAVEAWIQEHLKKDEASSTKVFDGYKSHHVHATGKVDFVVEYFNVDNINFRQIRNYKQRIPLNLGYLTGSIMANGRWIESFDGFPTSVLGLVNISGTSIKSWTGLPSMMNYLTIAEGLKETPIDIAIASETHLSTLNLAHIKPGMCLSRVMFFKGLSHIALRIEGEEVGAVREKTLMRIVNGCLNHHPHNRVGALQLQRELIEHDFDEFSDL